MCDVLKNIFEEDMDHPMIEKSGRDNVECQNNCKLMLTVVKILYGPFR
jgi:hypothetical protein